MQREAAFWSALQLYTQRQIRELSHLLQESEIVVTDQRNVSLYLDRDTQLADVHSAVEAFGRALICGPNDIVAQACKSLALENFYIEKDILYASADVMRVAANLDRISNPMPGEFSAHVLDHGTSDKDILGVQSLQAEGGLVPLPREGLISPRAVTVAIKNANSDVIGGVSLFDVGRPSRRQGWYQMAAGCVKDSYRGRGLGSWLHAEAISRVLEVGKATRFIASVRDDNQASFSMLKKFGIVHEPSYSFFYASVPKAHSIWRTLEPQPTGS